MKENKSNKFKKTLIAQSSDFHELIITKPAAPTNAQILIKAQAQIIERGMKRDYPVEQHLIDMDLITDLAILIKKYSNEPNTGDRKEK